MGVQGLWKLLESAGKPVALETLNGKVLAIDVSIWLHQALYGVRDQDGQVMTNAHLLVLFNRILKLLYYGIKPVFVFDGATPTLKLKTLASRQQRRQVAQKRSKKLAEKLLRNALMSKALEDTEGSSTVSLPLVDRVGEDPFILPPLPEESQIILDSHEIDSGNVDTDSEDTPPMAPAVQHVHDNLSTVDINSEVFSSLPPEIQHELIVEKQLLEKQTKYRHLEDVPEDAGSFSNFQLGRLLSRSKLSQRLDVLRKEMVSNNSACLSVGGEGVGDVAAKEIEMRKIASKESTHYILMKNTPSQSEGEGDSDSMISWGRGLEGRGSEGVGTVTRHKIVESPNDDVDEDGVSSPVGVATPVGVVEDLDDDSDLQEAILESLGTHSGNHGNTPITLSTDSVSSKLRRMSDQVLSSGVRGTGVMGETGDVVDLLEEEDQPLLEDQRSVSTWEDRQDGVVGEGRQDGVVGEDRQHGVVGEDRQHGVVGEDRQHGVVGEDRQDRVVGEDRQDGVVGEDKQDGVVGEDRQHRVVGEDKQDRVVGEDKQDRVVGKDRQDGVVGKDKQDGVVGEDRQDGVVGEDRQDGVVGEDRQHEVVDVTGEDEVCEVVSAIGEGEAHEIGDEDDVHLSSPRESRRVDLSDVSSLPHTQPNSQPQPRPLPHPQPAHLEQEDEIEFMSSSGSSDAEVDRNVDSEVDGKVDASVVSDILMECSDHLSRDGTISDHHELTIKADTSPVDPMLLESKVDDSDKMANLGTVPPTTTAGLFSVLPPTDENDERRTQFIRDAEQLPPEVIQAQLEKERKQLQLEEGQQSRYASQMSSQIYKEAQELISLFGLPYMISPSEAEAQCAWLDVHHHQVDGAITDDNDYLLFGGQRLYRYFFSQNHISELYTSRDIQQCLGLSQQQLILIALLIGSDYTDGIDGIGVVTAMEILRDFPGEGLELLKNFKVWHSASRLAQLVDKKIKNKRLLQLSLPSGFPDERIVQAYLQPSVDDSIEDFEWGILDNHELKQYAMLKFGWSDQKTSDTLDPVMRRVNELKSTQPKITQFLNLPRIVQDRRKIKSKRVRRAVARIQASTRESHTVSDTVNLSDDSTSDEEMTGGSGCGQPPVKRRASSSPSNSDRRPVKEVPKRTATQHKKKPKRIKK